MVHFTTQLSLIWDKSSSAKLHKYAWYICSTITVATRQNITWRTEQSLYQLLTMVDAGGIRTCVHLRVSPLLHCAMYADTWNKVIFRYYHHLSPFFEYFMLALHKDVELFHLSHTYSNTSNIYHQIVMC